MVPKPIVDRREGAEDRHHRLRLAPIAAIRRPATAREPQGVETSYLRVRALPLARTRARVRGTARALYVVELNIEARCDRLSSCMCPSGPCDFSSVAHLRWACR